MAKKATDTITTTTIPGGQAFWYTDADLPPRREKERELLSYQLNMRKLRAMKDAAQILVDGEVADTSASLDGPDVTMTREEAETLYALGITTTWAYLKGWSLKQTHQQGDTTVSEPRPLPATPDDLLDLPRGIFDALMEHGAKIAAGKLEESFTLEAVEDPDSPTTA